MQKDFLDELRKLALYFKLETGPKFGGAIDIDTLTKVLKALNTSFQNYFDAELRNVYSQEGKITQKVNKEIKVLQDEARLLVVDLKFESFEAGLAPNTVTTLGAFTYLKEPLKLKKQLFKSYEREVFYSDLNNSQTVQSLERRFSKEERASIFRPLEETVFKPAGYSFRYGKSFDDLKKQFKQITPEVEDKLIPPSVKPHLPDATYKIYVRTEGDIDLFGARPRYKKLLATEKLEHDDYPLQVHVIKYDDVEVQLKQPITAEVRYDEEEQLYYISYPELNINVWGKEREEADEAFYFTFVSLIRSIYNEDDSKLTRKAIELKEKLNEMINQVKDL